LLIDFIGSDVVLSMSVTNFSSSKGFTSNNLHALLISSLNGFAGMKKVVLMRKIIKLMEKIILSWMFFTTG